MNSRLITPQLDHWNFNSDYPQIDLWNEPMSDMRPVLTLVTPEEKGHKFLQSLNRSGIVYEVTANNFQNVIDKEREENDQNRKRFRLSFDYENTFHRYDDINNELTRITRNSEQNLSPSTGTHTLWPNTCR